MQVETDLKSDLSQMKAIKDFYQNLIFKFIRDVELFKSDEESKLFFDTLNENNVEVKEQNKLVRELENLDVPQLMIDMANIIHSHE